MELLGDVGHVESHSDPFGDSVSVMQYRCTVCAKCTTGLEIVLDTPEDPPRLQGSSGSLFESVWRCANLDAR
jgi:hypothetical protein